MKITNKINILFVAHDESLSGASLSLLSLLYGLNKETFNPYAIVPWHGELKNEIEKLGIPVYVKSIRYWIPFSNQWGLSDFISFVLTLRSRIWAISHIIDNHKIEIVYTNTVTTIDGAIAAYITKKPHIWHAREYIKDNKDIKAYIPSIFLPFIINKFSYTTIVNSESLNGYIKSKLLKCNIKTIYNGVDLNAFTNQNYDFRNIKDDINISSSTKLVGFVGSLCERKDIFTFIRAAKYIKEIIDDVAFVIVGHGDNSYFEQIKLLVDSLNLNQNVFFIGSRNDIPDIMLSIDVLVLTSEQEAFGKVIIEAMAASKPVVATKSGGPEEIIVDGETGFLVPVKNAQAIAEKVTFLLAHPEQAETMGQQGRLRAQSMFSMDQYVKNIEKVIVETINSKNR